MLPRPIDGICLSPFLNGPESPRRYLVEAGAKSYVVNFRTRVLIEALQHAGEPADVAAYIRARTNEAVTEEELSASITRLPPALFDQRLAAERQSPITCRAVLIPAGIVRLVAGWVARLYSVPFMIAGGICLMVATPFACLAARDSLQQTGMSWGALGLFGLGFIVSALAHELGHAAAVARCGLAPGHIGLGLYWFYPVFYTDVQVAWKLPPGQRVMVDLGGMYFQLLVAAGLVPFAFFGPAAGVVRLLLLFNVYSVLQNLNPVFKMDGYWLLADATRVPNIHRQTIRFWLHALTRRTADTRTRLVCLLYGLTVVAYLGYVAVMLPGIIRLQLSPRVSSAWAHLVLGVGSVRQADWGAAAGQMGLALQAAVAPAVAALALVVWMGGRWWRRGRRTAGNRGLAPTC
jgi:putative peptide zinc metalloprotease protein